MNAKEYLQQIKMIDTRIEQRMTQLKEMRHRVKTIGTFDYARDRVQMSPTSGNKQIEDIVDLERRIEEMIAYEQETKDKIISQIQSLDNPNYVKILYKRYVLMSSLTDISCELSYAYHYVCTLHGEALKTFEKQVLNNS